MEGLGRPAQRFAEALCAHRHDHELLKVHVRVGVRSAVEHVQHRRRQHAGIDAAKIAIERNLQRLRHGARAGHRDRQNRIRAQLALVRRAVQRNHGLVDQPLIGRVHAFQLRRNHALHIFDGLQNALAHVVALVAVAQLDGLMFAGRSARRHNRAAHRAAFQNHVCFHGRVSARVKNFACTYGNNLSHVAPHNAVLQPVVQFGTAIHGKSFSGGALNRVQKLLHVVDLLSVPAANGCISLFDSNKPAAALRVATITRREVVRMRKQGLKSEGKQCERSQG